MFRKNPKKKATINIEKKQFIEPAKMAARRVLEKYNLSPPVDLYQLAKEMKIGIHYRSLPANCDGWTVSLKSNLAVEYIILVNFRSFAVRQRFTIAHEIGHIVLNHCDRSNVFMYKHPKITVNDNFILERDADIFASELLIPTPHLLKLIKSDETQDIKRLSDFFQVSKQAMAIKLEEIKRAKQQYRTESADGCFESKLDNNKGFD